MTGMILGHARGILTKPEHNLFHSTVNVADVWLDNIVPIGLGHRCVHCIVIWAVQRRFKKKSAKGFKHWKPYLDENGQAAAYQSKFLHTESKSNGSANEQLLKLEEDILMIGKEGDECKRIQSKFPPSDELKQLRLQPPVAEGRGIKKQLSFESVKLHRRELRKWKLSNLQTSDGFEVAESMEEITEVTTWYWVPNCRSGSTNRICRQGSRAIHLHHPKLQKPIR